jgi:nitroreductase
MDGTIKPTPDQQSLLAARYGAGAPAAGPWNAIIAHLVNHRSVRGYKTDPVPDGTLETLITAASSAATSSNLQTWSVVVVDDPAVRAELARIAGGQKHIEQCPLFMVWIADTSRNERLGIEAGKPLEGLPYLETFLVAAIDAALASQNAVVAAEALGLSTVYIGALRNNVARVAELLGLPPGAGPVFGLCVGYPLEGREGEIKPRLPQSLVVHHGKYDLAKEAALRAAYDKEMEGFSARHEMAAATWSERVIDRNGTVASLRGRDKLAEHLRGLGFPLK